jgi:cyanophycinase
VEDGFDILTAEAPEWKSRLLRILTAPPTESENRGFRYYLTGSPTNAPATQPTKPGYLLAGGSKDQDAAFLWFLQKASHGDILILRGSGADGYHPYLSKLAPQLDSIESIVFQEDKSAHDPFVIERIRQADAIFLAGGNQWNYERLWRNTPIQRELNAAIQRGIPVGGTSAGLAVLGEFGFTAEHGGITSEEAQADPRQKKIAIEQGLIDIPSLACLITDSHFTQRKREGRLRVFLSHIEATNQCQQPPIGLGIDERTALLLEPDGSGKVVGEGAVHCYASPTAAPISAKANQTLNVKTCRP